MLVRLKYTVFEDNCKNTFLEKVFRLVDINYGRLMIYVLDVDRLLEIE